MNQEEKIIKPKLGLLKLARQLGNVGNGLVETVSIALNSSMSQEANKR